MLEQEKSAETLQKQKRQSMMINVYKGFQNEWLWGRSRLPKKHEKLMPT